MAADFLRDVQPILAEHCTQCHGVDEKERKSGLRLDQRDAALKGGDSGTAAIVPGKPDKSELIRRITSTDPDEVMPPPSHKKPLSRQADRNAEAVDHGRGQVRIALGVHCRRRKPPLPDVGAAHPVDAFVVARLKERKLSLSPAAPPATLCRRLYLDLIGLPPSPQELAAFEQRGLRGDGRDAAAERTVRREMGPALARRGPLFRHQRLRKGPAARAVGVARLGHRRAESRHAVRPVPHRADRRRSAARRDAGADHRHGFLRNSMINEEGAIVPEQFRMVEMFDRMDCLGKAVLGLTTQCAQCHTHKFDPLTQDEYYGMFAFLNNSYEAQSWVYTPEQQQADRRHSAAHSRRRRAASQQLARSGQQELAAWEAVAAEQQQDSPGNRLIATELGSISGLNHPTQEADQSLLMQGHTSADVFMIATPALNGVTGLRLEALNHRDLPHNGPGRSRLGTWAMQRAGSLRQEAGRQGLGEAEAGQRDGRLLGARSRSRPTARRRAARSLILIDGTDDTTWNADRGIGRRNQPSVAVVQFEQPLQLAGRHAAQNRLADDRHARLLPLEHHAATGARGAAGRSRRDAGAADARRRAHAANRQAAVFTAWRTSLADAKADQRRDRRALEGRIPQAATSVLHLAEREPANRRATHLLDRGNWDQPLQVVEPHTPAAFHPFPADAPRNRLGFAHWLADRTLAADGPRRRESHLAGDLRHGTGRDARGLRHAGRRCPNIASCSTGWPSISWSTAGARST